MRVEISGASGVLTVEVSDNGCGMGPQARAKPKSFGLIGLAERARSVGGWLDVTSRAEQGRGTGTSIILSVPLTASEAVLP